MKIKFSPLVEDARGRRGNGVVKKVNGKYIVASKPTRSDKPATPGQLAVQDRLLDANDYINDVMLDPDEEWSRVLEAAWPQYEGFFGAAPRLAAEERLGVAFFEAPEAFRAAIRSAGGVAPEGGDVGGYYDPVSRGVFLWRQPTRWFTRCLLLHEAAHQFHYLARTENRGVSAAWYVEGVAEHLAHHTWDGTTLRLGVVPPISLEDYAGKALAAATAPAFRLEALVARGDPAPRPEAPRSATTWSRSRPRATWPPSCGPTAAEMRVRWFEQGLRSGDPTTCDTFKASRL